MTPCWYFNRLSVSASPLFFPIYFKNILVFVEGKLADARISAATHLAVALVSWVLSQWCTCPCHIFASFCEESGMPSDSHGIIKEPLLFNNPMTIHAIMLKCCADPGMCSPGLYGQIRRKWKRVTAATCANLTSWTIWHGMCTCACAVVHSDLAWACQVVAWPRELLSHLSYYYHHIS